MKRAAESGRDKADCPKKRASTQDFESSTDDGNTPPATVPLHLMQVEEDIPTASDTKHSEATIATPPLSCTEDSSCGDDVDDEEETSQAFSSNLPPCEKTVEVGSNAKGKSTTGDFFKTGLVFEAGSKHFDRSNRFHKERPTRITSILKSLQASSIWDRCHVLEQSESANATKFLNDEDYLRVHLPGYMKR